MSQYKQVMRKLAEQRQQLPKKAVPIPAEFKAKAEELRKRLKGKSE